MTNVQLRDVCGVRSGDKGDLSLTFMDDSAAYDAVCEAVTVEMVATHLQAFVDQGAGGSDRPLRGPQPPGAEIRAPRSVG
ncbi:MAG: hypothetical protein R2789_11100 [Microthrixaceae bacterium]